LSYSFPNAKPSRITDAAEMRVRFELFVTRLEDMYTWSMDISDWINIQRCCDDVRGVNRESSDGNTAHLPIICVILEGNV
jgi:hypothetical protein